MYCTRYVKHVEILLVSQWDTIVVAILIFEMNLKIYIEIIRYLVQIYI